MNTNTDNQYYASVPQTLVKQLGRFRVYHPAQSIRLGTHSWQYLTAGQSHAPALLLLHGSGGDAEAMFRYIDAFSPSYHVIAPSLPPTISTVDDAVNGLRGLLNHEQVSSAHIIGMSFGAMLAQVFVRRFTETARDVIITHSTVPSEHLAEQVDMQRALLGLYPDALTRWLSRRAYRRDIASSPTPASDAERAFWQAYFTELYDTRFGKRHLLARARISSNYHRQFKFNTRDLREWRGKLLIIESDADNVIGEGDRGALKGMYPRAYVQTLAGYDHLAPVLAHGELAQSMRSFLQ